MSFNELIKRTCKKLGENNKPTYVVMAIAAVKGICRPLFTMMDKTESPETKKYTALREGLTEAIAIPAYWACGEAAGKLANYLYKNAGLAKRAEKNLMFMGVCTAALFVIPGLCSVAIKPIMDCIGIKAPDHENKNRTSAPLQEKPLQQQQLTSPFFNNRQYLSLHNFQNRPYTGLRIGGM